MLEAARANLNNPPPIMTVTAIKQNPGVINLVMDGLQPYLDEAPEMQDEMRTARSRAIAALDHYGRWLESDLLPRSNGNFRLGEDLWRKKLKFALSSDLTPEEILTSAERDLVTTRDQMYEIALPLFRDYFGGHEDDTSPGKDGVIRRVLARLADDHPTNDDVHIVHHDDDIASVHPIQPDDDNDVTALRADDDHDQPPRTGDDDNDVTRIRPYDDHHDEGTVISPDDDNNNKTVESVDYAAGFNLNDDNDAAAFRTRWIRQ